MECGPGTGPVATGKVFRLHNTRADDHEEVVVVDA